MTDKEKSWATAEDVARLAGVSRSAVSRTFTQGASVSPKTKAKVLEAARELGYQVDINARNMIKGRSTFVGVVTSGLENPFRVKLLGPLAHCLGARGMLPILMNAEDPEQIAYSLQVLLSYRIAGVIMTSGAPSLALAREYLDRKIPVAMLNRAFELEGADVVNSDNAAGGELAVQALVDGGATHFAFVGPYLTNFSGRARSEGFCEALKKRRVRKSNMMLCNTLTDGYESGQQAALTLFGGSGPQPDGVFCATDMIALGLMDTARREFGKRIPEDLRVVGFDDVQHAALDSYRLSTIHQNTEELARITVDVLVERMNQFSRAAQLRVVPVSFVRRATSG